jgi:hypothetical protein
MTLGERVISRSRLVTCVMGVAHRVSRTRAKADDAARSLGLAERLGLLWGSGI